MGGIVYKKLSPRRLSKIPGPRRKKPPVRKQAKSVQQQIEIEHRLLQDILKDRQARIDYWRALGWKWDEEAAWTVWTDFRHSRSFTKIDPESLPEWKSLTEYLKLQLGFCITQVIGGYAFTVAIRDQLLDRWRQQRASPTLMVIKRLRAKLNEVQLGAIEFAYAVEGRTRSGKSRSGVHLHGYLVTEDPLVATRFKMALERAFFMDFGKRVPVSKGIHMEKAYDLDTGDGRGLGRWVGYSTKHIRKWDDRFPGRRIFMSRSLNQATAEFWKLLRRDPYE